MGNTLQVYLCHSNKSISGDITGERELCILSMLGFMNRGEEVVKGGQQIQLRSQQ